MAVSVSAGSRSNHSLGGGSGAQVDLVNPNIIWKVADDPTESPSGSHIVYAYNVNTDNRLADYALSNGHNDCEGVLMVQDGTGTYYIAVWKNGSDDVDFYPRPSISSSQSLVTGTLTFTRRWSPSNGITGANGESFWYDKWEDRIKFIRERADSSAFPNNTAARNVWQSGTGWSSANISSGSGIPATTLSSVGSLITRPNTSGGFLDVPNANGDAAQIHEDVLMVAGVAGNPGGGIPYNNYVMYWVKESSESWSSRLSSGPHYPDGVIGTITSSGGSEHCAWDDVNQIAYSGPESKTATTNSWPVIITPGGGGGGGGSAAVEVLVSMLD